MCGDSVIVDAASAAFAGPLPLVAGLVDALKVGGRSSGGGGKLRQGFALAADFHFQIPQELLHEQCVSFVFECSKLHSAEYREQNWWMFQGKDYSNSLQCLLVKCGADFD